MALLHRRGSFLGDGGDLSALLAALDESVVGLVDVLDVDDLVIVHSHGGQSVGHLLLRQASKQPNTH